MSIDRLRKTAPGWLPYLALGLLTLFACWFYVGRHGVFASGVDWISQHSVFPDYFRRQFYETGQLFPEFAPNLGGGQNIYNFSYYGLYSPIVLFSYLLPFLKMSDYLMGAAVLCLMASVLLLYRWLGGQGFSRSVRLTASLLFLLAGPMIFHSYRHIMFVNYMPFLCMALIGIDRYYRIGRRGLYISGVFLMILTSFYYSIGGLLALVLYAVSACPRERKFAFLHLILPTAAAVLAAGVLLVPTALVLLVRTRNARSVDLKKLLIPDASPTRFVYGSYSVGVTTLTLTALWTELWDKDRRWRLLSLGCLVVLLFPIFTWVLNGGLYARDKALIPLLPLLCHLTASYLQCQKNRDISFPVSLLGCLLPAGLCVFYFVREHGAGEEIWRLLLAENALLLLCLLSFRCWRKPALLMVPPVLCLAVFGWYLHSGQGSILDRAVYADVTDSAIGDKISEVLQAEPGLYRLEQGGTYTQRHADLNRVWDSRQWLTSAYSSSYHRDYMTFREDTFQVEEPFRNEMMQAASKNPLFRKFMGVKYTVERDGDTGAFLVDTQNHTAPVIYAAARLLSPKSYAGLTFPYNQIALTQYAVSSGGDSLDPDQRQALRDTAKRARVSIPEQTGLEQSGSSYHIRTGEKIKTELSVPEDNSQTSRLLYLQFQVKNKKPSRDVTVTVDGIRNKLSARSHLYYNGNTTFTYVTVLSPGETSVKMSFGAGQYDISALRCFLGTAEILEDDSLYRSAFLPDWSQTKGNRICGEIQADTPGFLITSIPYDKGFTVRIDGTPTAAQRVNTAFLGASISAGTHQVEICYHAPGAKAGKLSSCLGLFLWLLLLLSDRRRTRMIATRTD